MMVIVKVILCVLLFQPFVFSWDDHSLDRVLTALHKGISWFDGKHKDLILDAVICNNIVHGQLTVLLERIKSGELYAPARHISMIKEIRSLAYAVRDKSLPYTLQREGNGNHDMQNLAKDGFWMFYHPSRMADIMLLHTDKNHTEWNGIMTDKCTIDLVAKGCKLTPECWDYITTPGAQKYYLTHQAFVLMNGEGAGCWQGDMYKRVNHETHRICTNALVEAMYESQNHIPLEVDKIPLDIFMERLGFCGMLGHPQIAQPAWLDMVLGWQLKPDGCWGTLNDDKTGPKPPYSFLPGVHCMDHMTAVGSIAMSQYVRYIIERHYNKGFPYSKNDLIL